VEEHILRRRDVRDRVGSLAEELIWPVVPRGCSV
jgi:hypothetical protein